MAVLDLDSLIPDRFSHKDEEGLTAFVETLERYLTFD